jgi:hypothetical protein
MSSPAPQNIIEKKIPESITPMLNRSNKFNEFRARSSSVMGPIPINKTPLNETKQLRTLIDNDANLIND